MEFSPAVKEYWENFLTTAHLDKSTPCMDVFYFDCSKESANYLLELVLKGQKKATCSSRALYDKLGFLPHAGDYSIVTDWDGNPGCVIKTKKVTFLTFKEMTFDLCSKEGEDDCLESWRQNHIQFFSYEGKEDCNYTFSEDMPIIFEEFEVVG